MATSYLLDIELELISPTLDFSPTGVPVPVSEIIRHVTSGAYKEYLLLCHKKLPFLSLKTINDVKLLKSSVRKFLTESSENDNQEQQIERELQVLLFGASSLQLFVLNNWTGPSTPDLDSIFPDLDLKMINDDVLQLLEVDGEHVYSLVNGAVFLYMAMAVFQQPDIFQHCKITSWWCLRYISIHQQLLSERSPLLHTLSKNTIEYLISPGFLDTILHRSHKIQLYLEMALLQLHYYQYKEAECNFETAMSISGIKCSLDGALGVRTRFQQKAVAQLRVQISTANREAVKTKTPHLSEDDIPKALPLNDDTLLENVKFSDDSESGNIALAAEEHALVLMMCTNMQKTSPSHRLRDEQLTCVIEYLLSDPKSWAVHVEALRARCVLERHRSRTVERSMMQLEGLVKNISLKPRNVPVDTQSTAIKRLSLFYSVWPKPSWILQKQLAALFESLGALSSSLEIYKRLHMWEEAIICLIRTDRGHEAEQLIRQKLAMKETPNLLCLLGDVLQDTEPYLKAWDVSKQRSARAMRSLGAYKISKKLYKDAVECFEKSLNVNYLQVGVWFSMGCAALANEDFEKAAKSFQKCVSLNWDNYEAWTNLSTAFVRCKKNDQAYRALKEGLKCNFDRWELWENFLFVCADTGHFRDLINAYNRLLDLKDKYVETSVLNILVRAITEDINDANELPASKLKTKALELFGRLTSKSTSNWQIWCLYAKLVGNGVAGENADEDIKALSYLQKSLRSSLQRQSWEKDPESAEQAVALSVDMIDACVHCNQREAMTDEQRKALLTTTRLTVNGVKAKLEMQENSLLTDDSKLEYVKMTSLIEKKLRLLSGLLPAS